jgi:hypothetical protein
MSLSNIYFGYETKMYFAVVGNFPEITLAELNLIDARDIKKV